MNTSDGEKRTKTFQRNFQALMDAKDVGQEAVARICGVSQAAVSKWKRGIAHPSWASISKLCETFELDESELTSDKHGLYAKLHGLTEAPAGAVAPMASASAFLPLRGHVHAGDPTDPEGLEGEVELPASVAENHPNAYFLEVEGDCMDKVYPEGCYILVDPDRMPADGSVAAVSIDGTDYVMRRLHRGASSMMLSPESTNPEHADIIVTEENGRTVSLVGTVVWYQARKELT